MNDLQDEVLCRQTLLRRFEGESLLSQKLELVRKHLSQENLQIFHSRQVLVDLLGHHQLVFLVFGDFLLVVFDLVVFDLDDLLDFRREFHFLLFLAGVVLGLQLEREDFVLLHLQVILLFQQLQFAFRNQV